MSEHRARILWEKQTDSFKYEDYNREHLWEFPKGGMEVRATAAPKYRGKPDAVDPEEALVAAISSCHMLTFISICSRRGVVVERYQDDAVGTMAPNAERRLAVTRVVLNPVVTFAPGHGLDDETMAEIHHQAHEQCFIANSVKTEITVDTTAQEAAR